MRKKSEESRNRKALPRLDSDSGTLCQPDSEYTTSLSGLQDLLQEKFTPKRERAEMVSGLYGTLASRYEDGVSIPDGDFHPVSAFLAFNGQKGEDALWRMMKRVTPKEILLTCSSWLLHFYSGHAAKVADCGTELFYMLTPGSSGGASLVRANFCRDRLCPLCSWRRSLKIFGQISKIMTELDRRRYRYLFLTLTIRNVYGSELPGAIQALYDGWRTLYHDYMRSGRRSSEKRLKGVVLGTFRAVEITVSSGQHSPGWAGSFHPHLHAVLAVDESYFKRGHYLSSGEWAEIWRNACGLDYNPSIKIEVVRPRMASKGGIASDGGKSISYAGAVAELAKYPLKDSDFVGADTAFGVAPGQYMDWLLRAIRGRRLIGLTGCFRDVARALKLDDMEGGDLVDVGDDDGAEIRADLGYLLVACHWRCGAYRVSEIQRMPPKGGRM